MYFQVLIETSEKLANTYRQHFELDKPELVMVESETIEPFLRGLDFQFDGYFLSPRDIKRIVVKSTDRTTSELSDYENSIHRPGVISFTSRQDILRINKYAKDITKEVFASVQDRIQREGAKKPQMAKHAIRDIVKTSVFVVHGHDDGAKNEVARFVEQIGFKAIILHEQASAGKTIIEKIEAYSDVGFAVVLYTACDLGASKKAPTAMKARARQNVVFEHGFLIGKLRRENVCALVKGDIEIPADISGIVYVALDDAGAWKLALAKELRSSGYKVNMNKVI